MLKAEIVINIESCSKRQLSLKVVPERQYTENETFLGVISKNEQIKRRIIEKEATLELEFSQKYKVEWII